MPIMADAAGEPREDHHPGDDRCRAQHDADLERGRGEFVIVILGEPRVSLVLGMLGALGALGFCESSRRG
jgi:hypothetical protein